MNPVKIATAFFLICICTSSAQVLTTLGSNGLSVASESNVPYSQTATTLTFNSSIALGDALVGAWTSTYDWSSYTSFGLEFSVSGTNPNLPISVTFYDTNAHVIKEYSLSTIGVGTIPTIVPLVETATGSGLMSAVAGFQLTWAGSGTINATFTNVVAVPEPATGALLAGGLIAVVLLRPRSARRIACARIGHNGFKKLR